MAVSKAA